MKKKLSYSLLLIILSILPYRQAFPQTGTTETAGITKPIEKITLTTDRILYSVNEFIRFSAACSVNQDFSGKPWSTVLYAELISREGKPVANGKFPLSSRGASGELSIPGNLSTGIYFIVAYTRWMRNFPTAQFSYYPVKIINPASGYEPSGTETAQATNNNDTLTVRHVISCTTDKTTYGKRSSVNVSVQMNEKIILPGPVSVTVVKASLADNPVFIKQKKHDSQMSEITFYPEIRGVSISGKIVNRENGNRVENAFVQLSLLNKKSFYSGYYTRNSGEFIFSLPDGKGKHDIFMEAGKEDLELNIILDDEFNGSPFSPPSISFKPNPNEKEAAYEVCLNRQVESAFPRYNANSSTATGTVDESRISFYGQPLRTVYTKKYINLPTVKEFIFELVPEFRIEYFRKIPLLKPSEATSFGACIPLVMLDNVPVSDLTKFLALPVDKIERFEMIGKGYSAGDIKHNGIFHAFSKNSDLAGIDLPGNAIFFSYGLFSTSEKDSTGLNPGKNNYSRLPDRRNTLYWNPDLILQHGKEVKFSFYTADMKGEYDIIVRSLSQSGEEIITGRSKFVVE